MKTQFNRDIFCLKDILGPFSWYFNLKGFVSSTENLPINWETISHYFSSVVHFLLSFYQIEMHLQCKVHLNFEKSRYFLFLFQCSLHKRKLHVQRKPFWSFTFNSRSEVSTSKCKTSWTKQTYLCLYLLSLFHIHLRR